MSTYATDTFAGDGSQEEFTLTFKYISRDHVEVFRVENADGAETKLNVITTGNPTGDEYIWESDSKIKVGTAPTAVQTLKIQRDTPENQQIVQWSDGSYLIAEDLNDSDLQWLYNIQELEDRFASLDSEAIKYRGTIDLTVDAAPASPQNGD
ncbi:MAG: phage tail fiber protein, partial [Synechococcus sp.]